MDLRASEARDFRSDLVVPVLFSSEFIKLIKPTRIVVMLHIGDHVSGW